MVLFMLRVIEYEKVWFFFQSVSTLNAKKVNFHFFTLFTAKKGNKIQLIQTVYTRKYIPTTTTWQIRSKSVLRFAMCEFMCACLQNVGTYYVYRLHFWITNIMFSVFLALSLQCPFVSHDPMNNLHLCASTPFTAPLEWQRATEQQGSQSKQKKHKVMSWH